MLTMECHWNEWAEVLVKSTSILLQGALSGNPDALSGSPDALNFTSFWDQITNDSRDSFPGPFINMDKL